MFQRPCWPIAHQMAHSSCLASYHGTTDAPDSLNTDHMMKFMIRFIINAALSFYLKLEKTALLGFFLKRPDWSVKEYRCWITSVETPDKTMNTMLFFQDTAPCNVRNKCMSLRIVFKFKRSQEGLVGPIKTYLEVLLKSSRIWDV